MIEHRVHVSQAVGKAQYPAAERHVVGYCLIHYGLRYLDRGSFALHDHVR